LQVKSILVPIDFTENSRSALRYATELAKRFDATVVALHVIPDEEVAGVYIQKRTPERIQEIRKEVEEEFEKFVPEDIEKSLQAQKLIKVGEPYVEIIRHARNSGVDLIVMATHGRSGISHTLLGSVAEKVVRKASCPVLTVKHSDFQFEMIL
jgi:nucleotide-binding universal stress UspA family protein